MFFASSGRIGVIIDIADRQLGLDLTDLQRNMASTLEGCMNHTQYVLLPQFPTTYLECAVSDSGLLNQRPEEKQRKRRTDS
jgi:hypothetical protein